MELIFATQYPRGLDPKVLEQVNFFVECRMVTGQYGPVGVTYAVHDWKDDYVEMRKRRPWPPYWWEADWYQFIGGIHQVFGHFPTHAHMFSPYLKKRIGEEAYFQMTKDEWARWGYYIEPVPVLENETTDDLDQWAETDPANRKTLGEMLGY
jgi:hypothetical protein